MENLPETNNPIPVIEPKKQKSKGGAWWALVLILVGVILLIQNLHIANFSFHWWALFIFIPVLGSLSAAWESLRRTGRFNAAVKSGLGSAIVVGTVGVILMFGLDWSRLWPLMLIAPGLSGLIGGLGGPDPEEHKTSAVWASLSAWVGLAVILLGVGFLAKSYPIPALLPYIEGYRWWAVPILVPGLGALIGAVVLFFRSGSEMTWSVWMLLLIATFTIATGVVAFFGMDWNMLFPIVLIACGIVVLAGLLKRK